MKRTTDISMPIGIQLCYMTRAEIYARRKAGKTPQDKLEREFIIEPQAVEYHKDGTISTHMRELVEINGALKPLCVWCRTIGLSRDGLVRRLKSGQTVQDALTIPVNKHAFTSII